MTPDLFDALSQLATDMGRPALLEDRCHRVLAYSRHTGVTDSVREQTILSQQAPAAVRLWLASYGLHSEHGPVHLPGNPELRMLPRLCLPIREAGHLFGFLWFLEGQDRVEAHLVERAKTRLPELIDLLHRQLVSSRAQLDPVLRGLLAGGSLDPTDHDVCTQAGLGPTEPVRVLAAAGRHPTGESWASILEAMARHAGASNVVVVPGDEAPAVIATGMSQPVTPPALAEGNGLGLGDEVSSVADLREAHRSAVDAATCAAVFKETGGFLNWSDAGLHRMVPVLARGPMHTGTLSSVSTLLADPRTALLAQTATVYLDLAGNVQAAAAALHLHRTSLYYRLGRFESLTGTDLREGTQRTAVHLALKVAAFHRATHPA